LKQIPDYLLKIESSYAWVLEAKAPGKNILASESVEQAYSYASHIAIRAKYFALCNGLAFSVFRTSDPDVPVLHFYIVDIEQYWQELLQLLSPESFITGKSIVYTKPFAPVVEHFDYSGRKLLVESLLVPVNLEELTELLTG
jgi:hypothetical protein